MFGRNGDKIIAAFLIDKDLGLTQRVEPTEARGLNQPARWEAIVAFFLI